jgi:hypothetical protein
MPPELNPAALNIPLRKMFSGSGSGDIFTGGGTPVKVGSRVAFVQHVPRGLNSRPASVSIMT